MRAPKAKPAARRLRLETLEAREVPAGDLLLQAFNDQNANGAWDAGEAGVGGVVVTANDYSQPALAPLTSGADGTATAAVSGSMYMYYATFPAGYAAPGGMAMATGMFTVPDGGTHTLLVPLTGAGGPPPGMPPTTPSPTMPPVTPPPVTPPPTMPPATGGGGSSLGAAAVTRDADRVYAGAAVTFDFASTMALPVAYAAVAWDFNYDGQAFTPDATAGGPTVEHTFADLGPVTVAARGVTAAGAPELAWVTFTVFHPAPVLSAPADFGVTAGDTPTLTLTADTGTPAVPITKVEWWVSFDGEDYERDDAMTTLTPAYHFDTFGNYGFWVVATDANGESGETWFNVTADEPTPTASVAVSGPINEGGEVTFTLQEFDTDALDSASIYADWTGNGEFDLVPADEWAGNAYQNGVASFRHKYADGLAAGVYHAVVRVENESGEATPYPVDLFVNNVAPTATLTAGYQVPQSPGALENVWNIGASGPVQFNTIADASKADANDLTFHFRISADGEAPGDAVASKDPWMILPAYEPGSAYQVEGWVTDKDGGESAHESMVVSVAGKGEQTGGAAASAMAYGSFGVLGESLPGGYNRYGIPVKELKDYAGGGIAVEMHVGAASQAKAAALGTAVRTVFHVNIMNSQSGAVIDDLTQVMPDGALQVGNFQNNEDITVVGRFEVNVNGQWTAGTGLAAGVINIHTPRTQTLLEQIDSLRATIEGMMTRFGAKAQALVSAVMDHPGAFFAALEGGVTGAVKEILDNMSKPEVLMGKLLEWVGNSTSTSALTMAFDPAKLAAPDGKIAFLLNFAGLTWPHVQQVLVKEFGAGNMAAVGAVAKWLEGFDTADPLEMVRFLRAKAKDLGVSPAEIIDKVVAQAKDEIIAAVAKATPMLIAKFVPGAGSVLAIVKAVQWLMDNQDKLQAVFDELVGAGADALIEAANGADLPNASTVLDTASKKLQAALVRAFNAGLPALLNFLAGQVGLGNLPKDIQKVVSYVPREVDKKMTDAVHAVAKGFKGGTASGKSDGLLGGREPKEFVYQTKTYELWETKESEKTFVKVGLKGGGQPIVLKEKDFATSATTDYKALDGKAKALAAAGKKPAAGAVQPANPVADMAKMQKDLAPLEDKLIADIKADLCTALDGGCFAAGTKLWTPAGFRKIEDIRQGEMVLSRDEHNPAGLVAPKEVERILMRLTEVWHLHVGEQTIRTTGEHPFYAHGKGWTAAEHLTGQDWILTAAGDWRKVDEVWNTGELETVYNLRVADWHTYFVGDDGWGWATASARRIAQNVKMGNMHFG